jgi:hypothetical protein
MQNSEIPWSIAMHLLASIGSTIGSTYRWHKNVTGNPTPSPREPKENIYGAQPQSSPIDLTSDPAMWTIHPIAMFQRPLDIITSRWAHGLIYQPCIVSTSTPAFLDRVASPCVRTTKITKPSSLLYLYIEKGTTFSNPVFRLQNAIHTIVFAHGTSSVGTTDNEFVLWIMSLFKFPLLPIVDFFLFEMEEFFCLIHLSIYYILKIRYRGLK